MSDGIECLSEEYLPTKTNKRKHHELGPDSMFPEKHKRVPSAEEQESDEVSHIRSGVLHKLVKRLGEAEARGKCKQGSTRIFAEAFERLLYAQAASIEDHADSESLDSRLNTIFSALIRRRSRRCRDHPVDRRRALRATLGHEKYQELESLLKELYLIRLGRAAPCGRMCLGSSCTMAYTVDPAPPLPKLQKMPAAVRNLFFGTRLMQIEYDPISKREDLLPVDWDELIKEAEKHVEDYHAWCAETRSLTATASS